MLSREAQNKHEEGAMRLQRTFEQPLARWGGKNGKMAGSFVFRCPGARIFDELASVMLSRRSHMTLRPSHFTFKTQWTPFDYNNTVTAVTARY